MKGFRQINIFSGVYFFLLLPIRLEVDFECTKHIDTDEEMGDEKVA